MIQLSAAFDIDAITVVLKDKTERLFSPDDLSICFSFVGGDFGQFLKLIAFITSLDSLTIKADRMFGGITPEKVTAFNAMDPAVPRG